MKKKHNMGYRKRKTVLAIVLVLALVLVGVHIPEEVKAATYTLTQSGLVNSDTGVATGDKVALQRDDMIEMSQDAGIYFYVTNLDEYLSYIQTSPADITGGTLYTSQDKSTVANVTLLSLISVGGDMEAEYGYHLAAQIGSQETLYLVEQTGGEAIPFNVRPITLSTEPNSYTLEYLSVGQVEQTTYTPVKTVPGKTKESLTIASGDIIPEDKVPEEYQIGYHFFGWEEYPSAADIPMQYKPGNTYLQTANVDGEVFRLNAVWEPNQSTYQYDANGGTGTMSESTVTYSNDGFGLPQNTFQRTGYQFAGWSYDAAAIEPELDDGAHISLEDMKDGETYTLYAIWTPNSYTIQFEAGGGQGAPDTVNAVTDESVTLPTSSTMTAEDDRYYFAGWATSTDVEVEQVTYPDGAAFNHVAATDGETVTLYAVWKEKYYSLAYDANGGSGTMETVAGTADQELALSANAYSREGYSFAGWSKTANGSVEYADSDKITYVPNQNGETLTLYAIWKPYNFTVTYDANGGTDAMSASQFSTGDNAKLPEHTFARKRYQFSGWATSPTGGAAYADGAAMTYIPKQDGDRLGLYAVWSRIAPTKIGAGQVNLQSGVEYEFINASYIDSDPTQYASGVSFFVPQSGTHSVSE